MLRWLPLKKPLAIVLFLLVSCVAFSGLALAQDEAADIPPLAVTNGVYVMSIYDLSFAEKSFKAVFWFWCVFPEDSSISYNPQDTIGVIDAKSFDHLFTFDEVKDSKRWVTVKFDAVIIHNWDMNDFPFDRQLLTIKLEEAEYDAKKIMFLTDKKNSGIDSKVKIPGWKVEGFSIQSRLVIDETTYGDPTLSERSTYAQTIVTIPVKREGTRLLINLLLAAYIAFALGILLLFMHPKYVDARAVIITTAMITIIGNHYIISATLPEMPSFTLIDRIMITTFISICFIAFTSIVTAHYIRAGKTGTAARINNIARWIILSVYVILNAVFYIRALT
jgi:hypothetical protein